LTKMPVPKIADPKLEDFDVVESSADEVSSSEDEEDTPNMSEAKKEEKDALEVPKDGEERRLSVGKVVLGLKDGSPEVEERLRLIRAQKLTFADYMESLDWDMLKLMFVTLSTFFGVSFLLFLLYLAVVYFVSEDLWYYYFPLMDDFTYYHHEL